MNNKPKLRMYQPIWESIKKNYELRSARPVRVMIPAGKMQDRVIKAVKKERMLDLAFRLVMDEAGRIYELETRKQGNLVFFNLRVSVGIADL